MINLVYQTNTKEDDMTPKQRAENLKEYFHRIELAKDEAYGDYSECSDGQ